jgi:histone H3/H4
MKKVVPSTAKLSKGAKESIQDCVSEFIGFVTAEAAEILKSKKRKTVNSEDILSALENTGFGSYKECLVAYTNVLRLENSKKVGAEPNEEEAAKSSGRGRKRKQVQLLTSNEGQNLQGFGDVNTSFDFQPPVFENPQPQQIEQQHHSVLQGFFDINKNLPF